MDSEPTVSRLRWLRDDQPKVPIDVAASGPKVIEIAARHADAITFAVGVDPYRLGWAVEHARAARAAAGLGSDVAAASAATCRCSSTTTGRPPAT